MKPTIRFKTSSVKRSGKKTGEYRYWSVVSLIINKMNEEVNKYDENMLTEGIFKNIWRKIKDWFLKMFSKIKEYVMKSGKNLIDFLQLEPQISMKNQIDFT
jgi:hypothetical protein